MMDRRAFVNLVAGTCLLGPLAVRAQQAGKIYRIGLLVPAPGPTSTTRIELEALRTGLRDLGWVEGKNVIIETRWAGANPQRQRELAAELKALPVALILALGTTTIAAARDGAPGLPVVMINAGDPVGAKFVASLARPGGDLTGTSAAGEEVLAKQVELLSAAVPKLKRVSVLMNGANPANGFFFDAMSSRAKTLGLSVDRIDVTVEDELDGAVARAKGGALVVVSDPMFLRHRVHIIELTLRFQVPSVFRPPRICRGRRFDVLCFTQYVALAQRSQLRRQDSEGRETRQYPGRAAIQVRPGDQPEDREGTRHHSPAIAAAARR